MTWPSNTGVQLLQAERDLTRAERQLSTAQIQTADAKAELSRAEASLALERMRGAQLEAALNQVYASTSWRLSRPVRVASLIIAAVRGRQMPPSAAPAVATLAPAAAPTQPVLPAREAAILQRLRRRVL